MAFSFFRFCHHHVLCVLCVDSGGRNKLTEMLNELNPFLDDAGTVRMVKVCMAMTSYAKYHVEP